MDKTNSACSDDEANWQNSYVLASEILQSLLYRAVVMPMVEQKRQKMTFRNGWVPVYIQPY